MLFVFLLLRTIIRIQNGNYDVAYALAVCLVIDLTLLVNKKIIFSIWLIQISQRIIYAIYIILYVYLFVISSDIYFQICIIWSMLNGLSTIIHNLNWKYHVFNKILAAFLLALLLHDKLGN